MLFGKGINDRTVPTCENGKRDRIYAIWHAMITRCYSPDNYVVSPTYVGVEVSEMFRDYGRFHSWYTKQIGWDVDGFELDKDILGCGKIYSEDVCCLVPYEINTLFILRGNDRGIYPLGVTKIKKCNTYISRLNIGKERKYLGAYPTPQLAHAAYVQAKDARIKEMARKYKDSIRQDVYDKLMEYEVCSYE